MEKKLWGNTLWKNILWENNIKICKKISICISWSWPPHICIIRKTIADSSQQIKFTFKTFKSSQRRAIEIYWFVKKVFFGRSSSKALKRILSSIWIFEVWLSESVQQIPGTFSISDRKLGIHTDQCCKNVQNLERKKYSCLPLVVSEWFSNWLPL